MITKFKNHYTYLKKCVDYSKEHNLPVKRCYCITRLFKLLKDLLGL